MCGTVEFTNTTNLQKKNITSFQDNGIDGKRNKFGETLLHEAAKKGDAAKVKQLLTNGAKPDVTDAAGRNFFPSFLLFFFYSFIHSFFYSFKLNTKFLQ